MHGVPIYNKLQQHGSIHDCNYLTFHGPVSESCRNSRETPSDAFSVFLQSMKHMTAWKLYFLTQVWLTCVPILICCVGTPCKQVMWVLILIGCLVYVGAYYPESTVSQYSYM